MKKYLLSSFILILAVLSASLTGCIVLHDRVDDIDLEAVSSIDIYDLRESSDRESGFYKNIDPVYTLDETKHSDFLNDLAKIKYSDTFILFAPSDPVFSYGDWVVRINYSDGTYRFVSCGGYGEVFDSDGNRSSDDHYGCDDEEWARLIGQYLPEEIFAPQK